MDRLRSCGRLLAVICLSLLVHSNVRSAEARAPEMCFAAGITAEIKAASIKAGIANMRVGPSFEHEVIWIFERRGLPVAILYKHGVWAHVRDWEGATGWMHASLLSDKPTALVIRDEGAKLRAGPSSVDHQIASLEKGVVGELGQCQGRWCELVLPLNLYPDLARSLQGWVLKSDLWDGEH